MKMRVSKMLGARIRFGLRSRCQVVVPTYRRLDEKCERWFVVVKLVVALNFSVQRL